MRIATRTAAALIVTAALFVDESATLARAPVLPIPTRRPSPSAISPKSGAQNGPIMSPNAKGGQKKGWSPFGGKKKVGSRHLNSLK
jgi:hypothetical protein